MAIAAAIAVAGDATTAANPGDRTISFYHIHTKETLTVTYKKDGAHLPDAMKKIDWILRDWRKNEAIRMDPQTIDLAWEMHNELGSQEPIHIISGYRSSGTNEMLRRTRGGQAKQSHHMTGKAIDISFPDVPLKKLRYSAMIRERGGVGYYPTSGIPFVHIDSARVRAWPRMPRYELALLFPDGRTKHAPASGGSITRADVAIAQAKHRDLALQLAAYHAERSNGSRTAVASNAPRKTITVAAFGAAATVSGPAPKPAAAAAASVAAPPASRRPFAVASLGPAPARPAPEMSDPEALGWDVSPRAAPAPVAAARPAKAAQPRLAAEPKVVDRPSRFQTASAGDRSNLATLAHHASLGLPPPQLVQGPAPATRPRAQLAAAAAAIAPEQIAPKSEAAGPKLAALSPDLPASVTDMAPESAGSGWVPAPEFDEDHPEELAYRPFPLAPLLTDTPSANDPQFATLQHPDVAATLDMIDDVGGAPPMQLRPGQQVAQVLWAQQFQGKAVHLDALTEIDRNRSAARISSRPVLTSAR